MNIKYKLLCTGVLAAVSSASLAVSEHHWYAAASAGIFQGLFNTQYNDQTDTIPQNFRQSVSQNSYNGGMAIGYRQKRGNDYFYGAELGLYGATYHANFAAGASSAAFTDTLAMTSNLDLVFVPGFFLTETVSTYAKMGLSYARVTADIYSPTGYTPVFVASNNIKYVLGAALGLGVNRKISDAAAVFVEYAYHDYGTINFSNFQNFTATYSHSAHVYSQSLSIGAAYSF